MDMDALIAQAAELQNKVAAAQDQLAKTVIKGVAPNGACIVDMTGKYDLVKLTINPDVLSGGVASVEQAVMAAYRDAKQKADTMIDRVMGDATAGIPMP